MQGLARVYLIAIVFTAGAGSAPLLVWTEDIAQALASPSEATRLLLRLLAGAWAALCVAYVFGAGAAFRGERRPGTLWAAVAANGGACFLVGATIVTGAWAPWDTPVRWILLAAAVLTGALTGTLLWYGLFFDRVFGGRRTRADPAPVTRKPASTPPPKLPLVEPDTAPAARAQATEAATAEETKARARAESEAPPGTNAGAKAKKREKKKGPGLVGRLRGRKEKPAPEQKS